MSKTAFLLATSLPELVTGTEQGQENAGRMGPLGSISLPLAQRAGKRSTGLSTSSHEELQEHGSQLRFPQTPPWTASKTPGVDRESRSIS